MGDVLRSAAVLVVIVVAGACSTEGDLGQVVVPSPLESRGGPTGTQTTPTPVIRAGGTDVVMMDAPEQLREGCREAATTLGYAVPCPMRVPLASEPIRCRVPGEFRGSDIEPQEGCVLGESFAFSPEFVVLPEDYIGVDGRRQDHLLVHASQALDRPSPCQGDVVERHEAEMGSQDATLWACGEEVHGVHAGHVVLVWRRGGVNYLVSAHGHTDVNFRLIERIAQNVEYVSP